MIVMMMASCIGQWTCTLGEIFKKGTECCSRSIREWRLTGCFIECCRMSIVSLYMTDDLPIFKFSETMIQTMWTYEVHSKSSRTASITKMSHVGYKKKLYVMKDEFSPCNLLQNYKF